MMIPLSIRQWLAEFYGAFSVLFVPFAVYRLGHSPFMMALALALSSLVTMFTLRHISGAHFNPLISVALWLDKRLSSHRLGIDLSAQFSGGFFALVSLRLFGPWVLDPLQGGLYWRYAAIELFLVYMLIYVVLAVSEQAPLRMMAPWIISVAYGVFAWVSLTSTGYSLVLTQILLALTHPWAILRVLLSSLFGTGLAVGFYRVLKYHPEPTKKDDSS